MAGIDCSTRSPSALIVIGKTDQKSNLRMLQSIAGVTWVNKMEVCAEETLSDDTHYLRI